MNALAGIGIAAILLIFGIFLISAIPLWLAIKLLGSKSGLLKVIWANFVVAVVDGLLIFVLGFIGFNLGKWSVFAHLVILFTTYMHFFELSLIKTIFAIIISVVMMGLLILLVGGSVGLSLARLIG